MKKIYLIIAAAVMTAACAKETVQFEEPEEGLVEYTFSAGADESKTTFNGTDFVWTPGDRISVFDSALKNRRFETEDSGPRASFRGRAKESASFFAFYPYNSSLKMEESGVVLASIPSTQKVAPGVISDGSNPTMGKIVSSDAAGIAGSSFLMKNIGGYVKIELGESKSPITYMSVSAVGGEGISGGVKVDYKGETPVATAEQGMSVIGLTAADTTFKAGTYYAVATPTTLSSGLKLSLVRDDDYSIEVPFSCSAITRNSARTSTLSLARPDELEWKAPVNDTLHVAFVDSSTDALKAYQAFEENLPSTSSPSSALTEMTCHLKGTGEEFFFSSKYLNVNSGTGLRLQKDGFITLPAVPGKRLVKVILTYGYYSTSTAHFIRISENEADGANVPGGEPLQLGPSAQGQEFAWTLSESVANKKYRLVNDDPRSTNDMRIRYLDLIYIGRNIASIASANITGASFGENDITLTGSLKAVNPDDGIITWGVEYREEHEENWSEGPTGIGTEISAKITGIDNTKVWYVRVYGQADAGVKVYSAERKMANLQPVVVLVNKFTKKEYDGSASGGYWKFTGDRNGYTYPIANPSARTGFADTYDYYQEMTDKDPYISGIIWYGSGNGYYLANNQSMLYAGYIAFPAKNEYRITKVVVSAKKTASGGNFTVTTMAGTSKTSNLLGTSNSFTTGGQWQDLTIECQGNLDEGVKIWPNTAYNIQSVEVTYAP